MEKELKKKIISLGNDEFDAPKILYVVTHLDATNFMSELDIRTRTFDDKQAAVNFSIDNRHLRPVMHEYLLTSHIKIRVETDRVERGC